MGGRKWEVGIRKSEDRELRSEKVEGNAEVGMRKSEDRGQKTVVGRRKWEG